MQKQAKSRSQTTRDSIFALASLVDAADDILKNPDIQPAALKIPYNESDESTIYDQISKITKAFDTDHIMSDFMRQAISSMFKEIYFSGDTAQDWEFLRTIYFDPKKTPKMLTMRGVSQDIGLNLMYSGNAFPYITGWVDHPVANKKVPEDIVIYSTDQIAFDVDTKTGLPKYKFRDATKAAGMKLDPENLYHVHVPKVGKKILALPPFLSALPMAGLRGEADQSIYSILVSFIAWILHITVDLESQTKGGKSSGSSKSLDAKRRRVLKTEIQAYVNAFKGSGKARVIGTAGNVGVSYKTLPSELLDGDKVYPPFERNLAIAMGKRFFGDVVLDSMSVSEFIQTYFQDPVANFWTSLMMHTYLQNGDDDYSKAPRCSFQPVSKTEPSLLLQEDDSMYAKGIISPEDYVRRRGLDFNDQMKKREANISAYPDIKPVGKETAPNQPSGDSGELSKDARKIE